jgi:L-ascorbate metabolism protein UlaG (beta-lactamase superfamily)
LQTRGILLAFPLPDHWYISSIWHNPFHLNQLAPRRTSVQGKSYLNSGFGLTLAYMLLVYLLLVPPPALAHGLVGSAHAQPGAHPAAPAVLELSSRPGKPNMQSGSIMFVGNATVLIRYAGFTILTDPNFLHRGEHVHLGYGLTSERLTDPALTLANLPAIDLIVLSHMHGDHFDHRVQEKLDRTIPIVTTPGAADALEKMHFQSRHALAPWQAMTVKKGGATLRITSMPARHGPPLLASLLPQTMGSMLEFSSQENKIDYRLYISGDTLVYDEIREIPRRFPDIDLALLHLGGTKILNMVMVTMDGKQGAEMVRIVTPQKALPIHYNDYDVFKSPIEDFHEAMQAAGLQDKLVFLKHGQTYHFKSKSAAPASQ